MRENKRMSESAVYATLASIVIIMSIVMTLLLIFSKTAFIITFALYLVGISIYSYVYFVRNPKNDINHNVNKLISIFNIGLGGAVVLLAIIFPLIGANSPRSYRG